jgi:predicted dehydrogenase
MTNHLNRRNFIRKTALVTSGMIAVPTLIPSCVKGANDKITLGMIGTGEHGITWNMKHYFDVPGCRIVAVCDVDKSRMMKAKSLVDGKEGNNGCKTYPDFRDLLARREIDAVQISTPDHWHVHQALMAMQAGKDVCCEKPTWTIDLGRKLSDYVKKSKQVYAVSLEDRSLDPYYRMAMLARNGHIGKVVRMRAGLPGNHAMRGINDTSFKPVPKDFDWEMWLGPAPFSPYSPGKTHFNFRWCADYSVGSISDWGAHIIDDAQWCIGMEKWSPVEVEGVGSRPAEGYYNTFNSYNLKYKYENGIELDVHGEKVELFVEGTEGWLLVDGWNQPLQASNQELLKLDMTKEKVQLYTARNEQFNFIDCIKTRQEPYHPAEDMHRAATVAHIGVIAMKLRRKLQWDPAKEEFLNDPEANAMRSREERDPWKLEKLIG